MGRQITLLDKVKLALRISTNAFDEELQDLIDAAVDDLGLVGISEDVLVSPMAYPLITRAVITYCKFHFGEPADPDRIKASYDEQKAQLMIATGYTEYGCHGQK